MTYQAKDSGVLDLQLIVQEVTIALGDSIITATSGSTVTVDFGETITKVKCALFIDNSAATVAPVVAANCVVSGTTVVFTLSAALAANDALIVQYQTSF